MEDTVCCQVCGKLFKRVTHKHLKHHNMTLVEYTSQYPDSPLLSTSTRDGLRTNSIAHFTKKFGVDEGKRKYDEYRRFQSVKNTFEYKSDTHGWSRDKFNEYNASRAHTRENSVLRYGELDGIRKWNDYTVLQSKNGVTLDWFISKYGQCDGLDKWLLLCKSKSHTLPNYIDRFGLDEGPIRYSEYVDNRLKSSSNYTSIKEQQVVSAILALLPNEYVSHSYHNKQYCRWSHNTSGILMYDLVITNPIKICIEFNGDYWHCNPTKYSSDYIHPTKQQTASDIWEYDSNKHKLLSDDGYLVYTIWESDWDRDNNKVLEEVREWLMLR
jgi:hypothetical protein